MDGTCSLHVWKQLWEHSKCDWESIARANHLNETTPNSDFFFFAQAFTIHATPVPCTLEFQRCQFSPVYGHLLTLFLKYSMARRRVSGLLSTVAAASSMEVLKLGCLGTWVGEKLSDFRNRGYRFMLSEELLGRFPDFSIRV